MEAILLSVLAPFCGWRLTTTTHHSTTTQHNTTRAVHLLCSSSPVLVNHRLPGREGIREADNRNEIPPKDPCKPHQHASKKQHDVNHSSAASQNMIHTNDKCVFFFLIKISFLLQILNNYGDTVGREMSAVYDTITLPITVFPELYLFSSLITCQ